MKDEDKEGPKDHDGGQIAVTVHYQQHSAQQAFRPNTTIEDVLDWAIGPFGIDPGIAGEFELARHGVTEELPASDNLGRIATGAKTLELDLVRGDIANGAGE